MKAFLKLLALLLHSMLVNVFRVKEKQTKQNSEMEVDNHES